MKVEEKSIKTANGYLMLFLVIVLTILTSAAMVLSSIAFSHVSEAQAGVYMTLSVIAFTFVMIMFNGFKIVRPNEAIVFTVFGKYAGTLEKSGFFYVNPFCSSVGAGSKDDGGAVRIGASGVHMNVASKKGVYRISTKISTLDNEVQKVNDKLGNPIMLGAIVVWKVENPTKAVFEVNDYNSFLSSQADSIIRNVARLYPYDSTNDSQDDQNELTLKGASKEIADQMQKELDEAVNEAGLKIIDVRINQIYYAPEIAAAMLQRQQAVAIIAARSKIVEGAVSMVKMALNQLKDENIVDFDEERKAQMVSNLLVVLCGNKDPQPVLNSGSIY